jgi:hypothetical protein
MPKKYTIEEHKSRREGPIYLSPVDARASFHGFFISEWLNTYSALMTPYFARCLGSFLPMQKHNKIL